MLIQELKKLQLQRELVSVRRYCSDEDQTGIFEKVNDEVVIFSLFSDEGAFEGYTFYYTEQIYEVLWGNREHKAISSLIKDSDRRSKIALTSESFRGLLKEASENYDSLCIYHADDDDSFDIAKIESFEDGWLKILTYGPMKTLSRLQKLIKFEGVIRITIDSPYQNGIVGLHSRNLE